MTQTLVCVIKKGTDLYGMFGHTQKGYKKLGSVINHKDIHVAKEVMFNIFHLDSMVYHLNKDLAHVGNVIGSSSIDYVSML